MSGKKVPELRFPGFTGTREKEKLQSLTVKIGDGIHTTPKYVEKSEYYFINGNNLENNYIVINSNTKCVSESEYKKHFIELNENTILLSINGTIGNIAFYRKEKVILGKSSAYLNLNTKVSKYFIKSFLDTHQISRFFNSELTGSTIKNLSLSTLRNTPIPLPSLPEQQKIAAFLSDIDKKIELLTRKKELMEQYKKGMMQKLFSRELRFKDENGEDFPDWEEKNLGEVYDFIPTNSLSRDFLNYEEGEIFNIHYGDIHTRFKSHFYQGRESVPFINPDTDTSKIKQSQFLEKGDIVIADASEDYADIGKAIEIIETDNKKIVGGLHTIHAKLKVDFIAPGFMGHYWKKHDFHKEIKRIAQGTKVLGLSSNRLKKLSIIVPSYNEQLKIKEILNNIENKIFQLEISIKKMNLIKKSFLQKMFI